MDNLATHIANLQIVDHDNDINPWVERFVRYCSMYDKALDPLRENLSRNLFIRYYTEGVVQWAEEERTDPRIVFSPEDQQAQEMFYHVIDDICATFDTAKKDDWKTCVRLYYPKCRTTDHASGSSAYPLPARQVLPPSAFLGISSL